MEALLAQFRAAAVARGPQWLQQHLSDTLGGSGAAPSPDVSPPASKRARRVRPPERLSPSPTPRVQRPIRSSIRNPSGSAAGLAAHSPSSGPGRNPRRRRDPRGRGDASYLSPSSPSLQLREHAAVPPADVPGGGAARRGSRTDTGSGVLPGPSGASSSSAARDAMRAGTGAASSSSCRRRRDPAPAALSVPSVQRGARLGTAREASSRRDRAPSAGSEASLQEFTERQTAQQDDVPPPLKGQRTAAAAGGSKGPRGSTSSVMAASPQRESSGESGEVSSAEDDDGRSLERRPALRSQLGSGSAAGRVSTRMQPGKSHALLSSDCQGAGVSSGKGGPPLLESGQPVGRAPSGQPIQSGSAAGTSCAAPQLASFFVGLRELLARLDPAAQGPTSAWTPAVSTGGEGSVVASPPPPAVSTITGGGSCSGAG